ncbi:MAG: serine hydrolase [Planctomycetes bacterium]|nr:serine hydrolase [Planctomycetota bacterium]
MTIRSAFALLALAVATPAQFVPDVVTYLDATPTSHQNSFTSLSGQGYRPISLSVAGGLASARYSAVWIRRSGAGYTGVHGVTAAQYETWRTQQRTAGRRPLLVTTAGSGTDIVYAGIWVADGVTAVEEIELYLSSLVAKNTWAYDNDHRIKCVSVRGTSTTPRFAGIWEENPDEDGWCWASSTASGYAADFNARVDGFGRLASAQTMPGGAISQIWHDDSLGGFLTLPGLTKAQLESEITTRRPSGWYPIDVQATGTGGAARFHVVFATRDRPLAKSLSRSGLAVTGLDAFDQYMEDHVRARGIRSSAIAISKDGRLVFARGYTLGESGYPLTQPTSLFRIASVSKPVSGLMTHLLIQRGGTITENTFAGAYVGLVSTDTRFNQIRVWHLIAHLSGLQADNTSWTVANWLNPGSPTLPINNWQTALWTRANNPFHAAPNTSALYSNLGYYLLGTVIEQASNKTYERFLREDLAAPMGITRIWVGPNERANLHAGEVEYRNRQLEITPSELYTDRRIVPVQFGGGGDENLTRRAAAGGVVTSPVDCVRLFSGAFDLACDGGMFTQQTVDRMLEDESPLGGANPVGFDTRAVRGNGVTAYGKNGQLWGSSTELIHRSDGVTIAVFDGKSNSNANRESLNQLADAVTSWPAHDLFPNYGLPAFNRVCPRIHAHSPASLPNLTDEPFVIDGDVLSGVDRIDFGSYVITSSSSTTWGDGWFSIVDDDRIELHPPQGLIPTNYTVTLRNGNRVSTPFSVSLTRATTRSLGATGVTFAGFPMIASRGSSSSRSMALLCFSPSNSASVLNGIVSLGIGARFAELWTWPDAIGFNALSGCARWQIPDFGAGVLHFQAVIVDPTSLTEPPFPTTNVRSVRGL